MKFETSNKKKWIIGSAALALSIIIIIAAVLIFANGDPYAKYILRVDTYNQSSDSIDYINYDVIIKDKAGWTDADEVTRAGIAKHAVRLAKEQANKEETVNYNVIGHTEDNKYAFVYDGVGIINIVVSDVTVDRVEIGDKDE